MYFAKWLGAEREVILSLAAKSVTNPIAIEITRTIGGIPAITAATVIVAGLVGQIAGYTVLKNTVGMPSRRSACRSAPPHTPWASPPRSNAAGAWQHTQGWG